MADGIHCLVFSKDRAMQLDAFLRSARRFAPYASTTVCWPGSLDAGYGQALTDSNDAMCLPEFAVGGFEQAVRWFLNSHERIVFHTDDDVFFRTPPNSATMIPTGIYALRLGLNTTYCHPLGRTQELPEMRATESWRMWRWREADGDFGYPLSLNGTIYRSADLLPLLDFPFANPTQLEAGLAARADRFAPEWMTAPLHSCCVSLPHNVVSDSSGCPRGSNPDWQPDALCEAYMDGWRIDLDVMDFSQIVGAHQEVPLVLHRP